jgi:hypothetical protein
VLDVGDDVGDPALLIDNVKFNFNKDLVLVREPRTLILVGIRLAALGLAGRKRLKASK